MPIVEKYALYMSCQYDHMQTLKLLLAWLLRDSGAVWRLSGEPAPAGSPRGGLMPILHLSAPLPPRADHPSVPSLLSDGNAKPAARGKARATRDEGLGSSSFSKRGYYKEKKQNNKIYNIYKSNMPQFCKTKPLSPLQSTNRSAKRRKIGSKLPFCNHKAVKSFKINCL
jgi:hypothetical protein